MSSGNIYDGNIPLSSTLFTLENHNSMVTGSQAVRSLSAHFQENRFRPVAPFEILCGGCSLQLFSFVSGLLVCFLNLIL